MLMTEHPPPLLFLRDRFHNCRRVSAHSFFRQIRRVRFFRLRIIFNYKSIWNMWILELLFVWRELPVLIPYSIQPSQKTLERSRTNGRLKCDRYSASVKPELHRKNLCDRGSRTPTLPLVARVSACTVTHQGHITCPSTHI
jgi:hypothetical protein